MNQPHGIITDQAGNPHFSLRRIAATLTELGLEPEPIIAELIWQAAQEPNGKTKTVLLSGGRAVDVPVEP